MSKPDPEILLSILQQDKVRLIRLHGTLGDRLSKMSEGGDPIAAIDFRRGVEADIRATAVRLVRRLDQASRTAVLPQLGATIRSTQTLLLHVAAQMRPESTDRFVVLLLQYHLEVLSASFRTGSHPSLGTTLVA